MIIVRGLLRAQKIPLSTSRPIINHKGKFLRFHAVMTTDPKTYVLNRKSIQQSWIEHF